MKVRKILSALISAVETGGEITLADDIVLGESYITVRNRVTVILNLGGHSITSTYTSGYNSDGILVGNNVIENYRTLTINGNGTIKAQKNGIYNYGTANISTTVALKVLVTTFTTMAQQISTAARSTDLTTAFTMTVLP